MGRIPQHFIDDLVARSDIVELINSRVPLKKAGREYKACCPFHGEKTPSFTVSAAKQFYHCFGCGAHGTAVGFLMEFDRMSFVEAVEELAARAGLDVPREAGGDEPTGLADLFDLMAKIARFYEHTLKKNAAATRYLRDRGVSGDTAAAYEIGYVPDRWDCVLAEFGKTDSARRMLLQAGMIVHREGKDGHYDRFRGRIMFPIRDYRGRVVGFGGRVMGDAQPKYLNSPETDLFHKGRELYGLYEARQSRQDLSRLLVVEGYMDAVGLAQHGIQNAVATLGTATTAEHLKRLFRVANSVVFCFDGDRAGRAAGWRALQNALPEVRDGRQMSFLFLPDGEDPDSLVRAEGPDGIRARLDAAVPLSDFLIGHLQEGLDLGSVDGRARLAELARPLIARIPEGVYRTLLVEQLSERIGTGADRLAPMLAGGEGAADRPRRRPRRPAVQSGRGTPLRQAITLLLHHPSLAAELTLPEGIRECRQPGVPLLVELVEELAIDPHISTAGVLERWRDRESGRHLSKLAAVEELVDESGALEELRAIMKRIAENLLPRWRTDVLLEKSRSGALSAEEKQELTRLLKHHRPGSEKN